MVTSPNVRSDSGKKVLKKKSWNKIKQGLVWSRFIGKGLAEDNIGLVIKSPTNGTEEPCVEFRHYFLFKTSVADLLKIF